jgi:uncharacterized membrane protein YfcA
MEWIIVITAFLASLLTLISGFGLGTLMTPVFVLFFPVELAIALTAVVHLLNNIFKFGLLFKSVDRNIVLWFGVPGILGAYLGATVLSNLNSDFTWFSGGLIHVRPLQTIIGILMIAFAILELFPRIKNFKFDRKYLVPGGVLSGFFGGLSGHQGALRSMFLIRANLSVPTYISTGIAIALLVDLTRIPVYFSRFESSDLNHHIGLLAITTFSAFGGAFLGKRLMKKVTFRWVQILVAVLMIAIGVGLILGLLS